jgi:hypothetical protein
VPNNQVDNLYDAIQDTSSTKAITKVNTQVKDSGRNNRGTGRRRCIPIFTLLGGASHRWRGVSSHEGYSSAMKAHLLLPEAP